MGDGQDRLAKWRAEIPGKLKGGGFKARYWRLALKHGRLPTLQEEWDAGIGDVWVRGESGYGA